MLDGWLNSIWAISMILMSGAIFSAKCFSFVDTDTKAGRNTNIDGLRFLLASFVAMHHFVFSYNFTTVNRWYLQVSEYPLELFFGGFGVSIFFMISGYLFIDTCEKNTNWAKLYINRFFRIAPMTFVSSLLCILIALMIQRNESYQLIINDIIYWFDAGVINNRPDLFGMNETKVIMGGVTWTLKWEWILYFSLPFLTYINRKEKTTALLLSILFIMYYIVCEFNYNVALYSSMFAMGAICKKASGYNFNNRSLLNLLSILLLISCFVFSYESDGVKMSQSILYWLFFITICVGANLYGLLNISGFKRLGDASFSIYILHSTVWFVMNKIAINTGAIYNKPLYYTISSIAWFSICMISILSFHFVEKKFISIGRKVSSYV